MKQTNNIYKLLIFICFGYSISHAGGIGDGGGQGIVCRNEDGTVRSAQLLDLAEAENFFLLKLQDQPKDRPYLDIAYEYAAILDAAIPSSNPTSQRTGWIENKIEKIRFDINPSILLSKKRQYSFIRDIISAMESDKIIIPGNNFKLPPVRDSHPKILPSGKGCDLEQVAFYKDGSDQVRFIGSVWDKLDNTNKAALLIHEALYRSLRQMGDINSDRTRKAVGYLFGGMNYQWVLDGLPQKYLFCWTNDVETSFQFAVYPHSPTHVIAQFLVYNGEVMLQKTMGYLKLAPFASPFGLPILEQRNESILDTIDNPLLDIPKYNFSIDVDNVTKEMKASIEAFILRAGENLKPITCNEQLSIITYGADGSVSVGSTTKP